MNMSRNENNVTKLGLAAVEQVRISYAAVTAKTVIRDEKIRNQVRKYLEEIKKNDKIEKQQKKEFEAFNNQQNNFEKYSVFEQDTKKNKKVEKLSEDIARPIWDLSDCEDLSWAECTRDLPESRVLDMPEFVPSTILPTYEKKLYYMDGAEYPGGVKPSGKLYTKQQLKTIRKYGSISSGKRKRSVSPLPSFSLPETPTCLDFDREFPLLPSYDKRAEDEAKALFRVLPGLSRLVMRMDINRAGYSFRLRVIRAIVESWKSNRRDLEFYVRDLLSVDDDDFLGRVFLTRRELIAQSGWLPEVPVEHKLHPDTAKQVEELTNVFKDFIGGAKASEPEVLAQKLGMQFGDGFFKSIVNLVPEKLRKAFDVLADGADAWKLVLLLGVWTLAGYICFTGFGGALRVTAVTGAIAFTCALYDVPSVLRDVIKLFPILNSDELEMSAQSLDAFPLPGILASVLVLLSVKDGSIARKAMEKVKGISLGYRDFETLVKAVVTVVDSTMDILSKYNPLFKRFKFCETELPEVNTWIDTVTTFAREVTEGKILVNAVNGRRVFELEAKGVDLLLKMTRIDRHSPLVYQLRSVLSSLNRIKLKFETAGVFASSSRPRPTMIMLRGNSQIGKTTLIKPLLAVIMKYTHPDLVDKIRQDLDSMVYNFNEDTEHWDGYFGQLITVVDEYGVARKKVGDPTVHHQVIKIKNTFPYMLKMAELDRKGATFFRSEFIVGTSNVKDLYKDAREHVTCPEALTNRVDFDIEVSVKPEFCTVSTKGKDPSERILDKSLLKGFTFDIYEFRLATYVGTDSEKRKVVGDVIELRDLVKIIINRYQQYARDVEFTQDAIASVLDDFHLEAQMDPRAFVNVLLNPVPLDIANLTEFLGNKPTLSKLLLFIGNGDCLSTIDFTASEDIIHLISYGDLRVKKFVEDAMSDKAKFVLRAMATRNYDMFDTFLGLGSEAWSFLLDRLETVVLDMTEEELMFTAFTPSLGHLLLQQTARFSACLRSFVNFKFGTSPFMLTSFWKCWLRVFWVISYPVAFIYCVVSLLQIIWRALSSIFQYFTGKGRSEPDGFSSGDYVVEVPKDTQAQVRDFESVSIANSVFTNNVFRIYVNNMAVGFGTFVYKQYFLTNTHLVNLLESFDEDIIVRLISPVSNDTYELRRSDFLNNRKSVKDFDLSVFNLSVIKRMFRDIRDKFATENDIRSHMTGNAIMTRMVGDFPVVNSFPYSHIVPPPYPWRKGDPNLITLRGGFQYPVDTRHGECGLLLFFDSVRVVTRKIFGMHACGSGAGSLGICTMVSREMLDKLIPDDLVAQGYNVVGPSPFPCPTAGSRSAIVKSRLYGRWGPSKKTNSRLREFINSKGEKIDPYRLALSKYENPICNFPKPFVDVVLDCCFNDLRRASLRTGNFSVKDLKSVIVGIPGSNFSGLERSTSPGYPWNTSRDVGYAGKEAFIGKDRTVVLSFVPSKTKWDALGFDLVVDAPRWMELRGSLIEQLDILDSGQRVQNFVYHDCLKDELVSLEKAEIGKTRLFAASPMNLIILSRIFFGGFIEWMLDNRIFTESLVGINVYSEEWDVVAHKLNRLPNKADGDFKGFDTRQNAYVLRLIGDYICSFYDDDFNHIRKLLWMEIYASRHIVDGMLVEWDQSMPSGNFITTLLNIFYNMFLWRAAYLIAHRGSVSCLDSFATETCMYFYGDDVAGSFSDYAVRVFDRAGGLPKIMSMLGQEFTSSDKTSDFKFKPRLEDITLLKRHFFLDVVTKRYIAPLSLDTVREMPYWTKRSDRDKICKDNFFIALLELSLHPADVFVELAPRMVRCFREVYGYAPPLLRQKDFRMIVSGLYGKAVSKYQREIFTGPDPLLDPFYVVDLPNNQFENIMTESKIPNTEYLLGHTPVEAYGDLSSQMDSKPLVTDTEIGAPESNAVFVTSRMDSNVVESGGTRFDDEANVRSTEITHSTSLFPSILGLSSPGFEQDLMTFMGKPQYLSSFSFTTTSTAGSTLATYSFPSDLFAKAAISQKATGFLNFRGTLVFRLQVNAYKFQAGRLLVVFIPQAQVAGMYPGMRRRSLMSATQLPRVELDVGCDTEVTMRIPYISPLPFYDFEATNGPMGRVYIMSYSPLTVGAGGSANCDCTVFAHFEDVQLQGPTYLTAQMAPPPKGKGGQAGDAEEAASGKPISSGLRAISAGFGTLSQVPLLSKVAGPVSWATGLMSGVASAFGYSNPRVTEVCYMKPSLFPNFGVSTSFDETAALALSEDNKVGVLPGLSGSDIDETNISHLCQRSAWLRSVTWSTTNITGDLLTRITHCPTNWKENVTGVLTPYNNFVPSAYLAMFFAQWRGSMRITIKVVKTSFHTGRLMLVYRPSTNSGAAPTLDQTSYCLREILDMRERNEWSFVLPYAVSQPYLSTGNVTNLPVAISGTGVVAGEVFLYVLNDLRAPETAAQQVDILIEVSGGPDIEFAVPKPLPLKSAGEQLVIPFETAWLTAQMDDSACGAAATRGIGGSSTSVATIDPSLYCVGENVTSLLQLLKRRSRCDLFTWASPATTYTSLAYDVRPFSLWVQDSTDGTVRIPNYGIGGDYVNYFFPMFAYSRGGCVMTGISENPTANSAWSAVYYPDPTNTTPHTNAVAWIPFVGLSNLNKERIGRGYGISVYCPQYTRTYCRLNRVSPKAGVEPIDIYSQYCRVQLRSTFTNVADISATFYRKVADDCQLGFFLGTPPVATP